MVPKSRDRAHAQTNPFLGSFKKVTFAVFVVADKDPTKAPPPPPFLEGEPESTVDEYKKILETGRDHPEEVDGKVEEWIKKQSDKVQGAYKKFTEQQKALHVEAIALHKKATEKYSPEAKEADAKILAIVDDKKITGEEKGKKIAEILKSYPESVRKELEEHEANYIGVAYFGARRGNGWYNSNYYYNNGYYNNNYGSRFRYGYWGRKK